MRGWSMDTPPISTHSRKLGVHVMVYPGGGARYTFRVLTGTRKGTPPLSSPDREPISIAEWQRRRDRSQQYAESVRSNTRRGWAPRLKDMLVMAVLAASVCLPVIGIGWLVATIFA